MKYLHQLLVLLFCVSCMPDKDELNHVISDELDSLNKKVEEEFADCDSLPTVKFSTLHISNSEVLENIRQKFKYAEPTSTEHQTLTTLNRKDFRFVRVGDTIIVPEYISEKITDYSLFPACYPKASHLPKLVLVSNKYQCYACYENGHLIHYAAANTGSEKSQTYPGRYYMTWKQLDHRSSLDSNWHMPYTINFHLQAGNAFHQFSLPGRPVSHSCIREFRRDAKWLYEWSDRAKFDTCRNIIRKGTMVLVLDAFDFARPKFGPWLDLADNKSADISLPSDPENYEMPFIPIHQIPRGARGDLDDYARFEFAEDTLRARGIIRSHVEISHSFNRNEARRKAKLLKEQQQKAEQEAEQTSPASSSETNKITEETD